MSGRVGRWGVVLLAAWATGVMPAPGGPAPAGAVESPGKGRRVLGSFRTEGHVEGSVDGRQWLVLYPNAAVLDGMKIRIPGEGSATLNLVGGDQVVFDARSSGEIANDESTTVRLDHGRMGLHLKPASKLVVESGRGVVRTVPGKPMAVEAVVRRDADETVLETKQGVLELRAVGSDYGTVVEQGYQAQVGPSGPASGAMRTSSAPPADRDRRAAAGFMGIAGVSPIAAAVVGGVAAVGAGVGAAAGSGAFSSDDSSSPDTVAGGGREGSPFRPVRQ